MKSFTYERVDSPTAAATGSTVNYRTMVPTEEFGVKLSGSAGEYSFMRIFGLVNTGAFTPGIALIPRHPSAPSVSRIPTPRGSPSAPSCA